MILSHMPRRTIAFGDELDDSLNEIAEEDPDYDNFSNVVRAACRRLVQEKEEYGEAT